MDNQLVEIWLIGLEATPCLVISCIPTGGDKFGDAGEKANVHSLQLCQHLLRRGQSTELVRGWVVCSVALVSRAVSSHCLP